MALTVFWSNGNRQYPTSGTKTLRLEPHIKEENRSFRVGRKMLYSLTWEMSLARNEDGGGEPNAAPDA